MQQKTLTVPDVAQLLGVSTVTIYSLVREQRIPHLRIRSRILFRLESITEWMDHLEGKVVSSQ
ncbi:MAG: helix-turn-helix domain-containing protein [Paenibacillaceae bacterium]